MVQMTDVNAGFPRAARLLTPAAFRLVFAGGTRVADQNLTLLARTSETGHPRIGLAIAKRKVPRAVDRNRIKRAVRESFRLRAAQLPALDIVVMAKPDASKLEAAALTTALDRLWSRLTRRCAGSS